MEEVIKLNSHARKLLMFLHSWHLKAGGGPFHVGPCPETFAACGLDEETYLPAARRLVNKQVGDWMGAGGMMTITDYGVEAAEDSNLLDQLLPLVSSRKISSDIPQDIAENLNEIRQTTLNFVSDDDFQAIIRRDLDELDLAVGSGMNKCIAILSGSILESLLVDTIALRPDLAQAYMGKKKFPADASIDKLVEIAVAEMLLDPLACSLVSSIKDYRDLVHPDRERRMRVKLDGATSGGLLALLRLVVRSLHSAHIDGQIESYKNK